MDIIKRKLLNFLAVVPSMASCVDSSGTGRLKTRPDPQQRFKSIPLVLMVDAVPDSEMLCVEFFADGREVPFLSQGAFAYKKASYMSFPYGTVPLTLQVVWRQLCIGFPVRWGDARYFDDDGLPITDKKYIPQGRFSREEEIERRKLLAKVKGFEHTGPWGSVYTGKLAGDYTFLVNSRIPDDVLCDIRQHGGSLRLKFRLKPDGVMFGWDIERSAGNISVFSRVGGDFKEARFVHEKIVEKGWYINNQGQRIETNW